MQLSLRYLVYLQEPNTLIQRILEGTGKLQLDTLIRFLPPPGCLDAHVYQALARSVWLKIELMFCTVQSMDLVKLTRCFLNISTTRSSDLSLHPFWEVTINQSRHILASAVITTPDPSNKTLCESLRRRIHHQNPRFETVFRFWTPSHRVFLEVWWNINSSLSSQKVL